MLLDFACLLLPLLFLLVLHLADLLDELLLDKKSVLTILLEFAFKLLVFGVFVPVEL